MFTEVSLKVLGRYDWHECETRNVVETTRRILGIDETMLYFEAKGAYDYSPNEWTGMYTIRGAEKIQKFFNNEEVFVLGGLIKVKLLK